MDTQVGLFLLPLLRSLTKLSTHPPPPSVQVVVGAPENIVLKGGGLEGEYVFDQMHFHWGSEHTIDGRRYALELHMVHHDRRYSLQEALTKKNGIAVLGVLFHVSLVENKKLQIILNSVDDIAEVVGAEAPIKDLLRITDLMPVRRDSYFRYEGSLTTPSCMESVVWTIFTQTIPVSLHQLERLKMVKAADGKDLLNNYRQVQPLNARALVYASNEKADGFLLSQYMSGASALSIRIEVMAVLLLISLWILMR